LKKKGGEESSSENSQGEEIAQTTGEEIAQTTGEEIAQTTVVENIAPDSDKQVASQDKSTAKDSDTKETSVSQEDEDSDDCSDAENGHESLDEKSDDDTDDDDVSIFLNAPKSAAPLNKPAEQTRTESNDTRPQVDWTVPSFKFGEKKSWTGARPWLRSRNVF